VFDDERLTCDEHPARDAGAGREPLADQRVGPLAGDRLEHELVPLLVEEEDRGRLRPEDRARDLDRALQQRAMALLRAEDAGSDRGFQLGHAGSRLDAVRWRTLLSWKGVRPGCLLSTSAQTALMWGVAKELPAERIVPPPSQ